MVQTTETQVIRAGWIYPNSGNIIRDGMIKWSGKKIEYIGEFDKSEVPRGATIYHYPKAIVTPPFINSHTHIPETLIRGIADDFPLETWLYEHIWKVEPQMTSEDAKIGTQLGIAEMISTGTIGIVDQFYYAQDIAEVVAESGTKAFLSPSIFSDNPETGTPEAAFKLAKSVYDKWHGYDERISIGFGPHALYSVDHDFFVEIANEARDRDTMIHTHVAETKYEVEQSKQNWGMSPVKKLDELGVLDTIIAAHCVHLDDEDIQLLNRHDTTILHNIQSNLKLGSGIAPIPEYLKHGLNVVLGTDGSASNNNLDMLEEIRLTALLHKGLQHNATTIPMTTALKMATSNNNAILSNMYQGKLEVDQPCDLAVFDLDNFAATPIIDPLSNLIYSLPSNACTMTVSNGRILYKDQQFLTLNIGDIKEKTQAITDRMITEADYSK